MAGWTAATVASAVAVEGSLAYSVVYAGVYAAVTLGISYAAAALAAPDAAKPDSYATPLKQTKPERVHAYGRNRLAGSYVLWEAGKGRIYDVIALHDGRIEGFDQFWLHDDKITVSPGGGLYAQGWVTDSDAGDGRYGLSSGRVFVFHRLGLATETSYLADFTGLYDIDSDLGAGVWTEDHRGDGIASLAMRCRSVEQKDFSGAFPNGPPNLSATIRALVIQDWRDPAQDPEDEDTLLCSFNPAVQLADYLTSDHHGMALDWAARIAPNIDEWTLGADDCDEAIDLKAGGTEPRYQCHWPFKTSTPPIDIIGRILESCDGWLSQKGDGSFTFRAGVYREPDVIITDDHVTDYSFQRFVEDEQRVDGLVVSFTSPDHDFREVETDPWADVYSDRVDNFAPLAVQSHSQARRLAKRRFSRLAADLRGTFKTNLYGLRGLGERFIRLQISEVSALSDVVVEITGAEIDLQAMTVSFSFVKADENIDSWNPATEEGDGPALEERVGAVDLPQPDVDDVTPFFESAGVGGEGVRLRVQVSGADREDASWFVRWRVVGAVSWNEAGFNDIDPEEAVVLETGFVPADADIEVETAYATGSAALSPWSEGFEVSTSLASVAPAAPTELAADIDGADAVVSWRNPVSANLDHIKLYRATSASFGSASQVGSDIVGGLGEVMAVADTPGTGTWYYWVTAANVGGTESAPAGPDSVTL